ncbi:uncharacterized protein LOC116174829 [Photinus pyralis]|uniref:uncharacterized protein LOC116174829 n=1 Tax=Photinus pyralis TaxID=7054 RepID=UPI0012674DA2|nr:uncharacterized protein LOC116174829 [Photinus pyralis]
MTMFLLILILAFKTVHGSYLGEKFAVLSSPTLLSKAIERYLSQNPTLTYDCQVQLVHFVTSLQKEWRWALDMYDANGKLPPGIFRGNFAQLGSFDQCIAIENVGSGNKSLAGKYCLGSLSIPNEYHLQQWTEPTWEKNSLFFHHQLYFRKPLNGICPKILR